MSRPICRDAHIDHLDGRLVVAVEDGGGKLREAKLKKERAKVASLFGGADSGIELRLGGGASCSDGLRFAFVRNATTGQHEGKTSGGAAIANVIGMGSIKKEKKLITRRGRREVNIGGGHISQKQLGARRQIRDKGGAPKMNTPGTCAAEILGNLFEEGEEVVVGRGRSKLAEHDDGIANVGATSERHRYTREAHPATDHDT